MTRTYLRPVAALFAVLATMSFLTACETFEGFGRDVQGAGQAIENEAERN